MTKTIWEELNLCKHYIKSLHGNPLFCVSSTKCWMSALCANNTLKRPVAFQKAKRGVPWKELDGQKGGIQRSWWKIQGFMSKLQQAKKWSGQKMGKHEGWEERNRVNRHFAGRPIVRLNLTLIHGSTIVRWKSSEGLLRWAVERGATKAADSRLSVLTSMKSAALRKLTRPYQLLAAVQRWPTCINRFELRVEAQKHNPDKLVVVNFSSKWLKGLNPG